MKKPLLVCCFILNWVCSDAQQYFNDTLWFNATYYSIIGMVYPTDSGTYVVAQKGNLSTGTVGGLVLGFVDTNGLKRIIYEDLDVNNDQRLIGANYNLFLNQDSNFVLAYANNEQGVGQYPRIKEISPQGIVLHDVQLDTVLTDLHYGIFDYTKLVQRKMDSSYWLFSAITVDLSLPSNDQRSGVLLTILNANFSIDTICFYYFDPLHTYSYYYRDGVEVENGKFAMLVLREKAFADMDDNQYRLFLHYLDTNGSIVENYNYAAQEKTGNQGCMIRGLDTHSFVMPINQAFTENGVHFSRSCLAKFDNQLHLLWRTQLSDTHLKNDLIYFGPRKVIATSDHHYLTLTLDWNGEDIFQTAARISKIDSNGVILWTRFFYKYDRHNFNSSAAPSHDLVDMQEAPDGGFVFGGQVFNWEGFNQQVPFQTAWMAKVNCLGFIGSPNAAVAWQSGNENTVRFYNTSLQAANYLWDFGDGSTFEVDDTMDTLFHHYQDTGTYTATLIAYGCRETDTLYFTIKVTSEPEDIINNAGEGYFTFYPNPIISGNTLYVYLNGMNEAKSSTIDLTFYDYSGNLVRTVSLSSKEGNYMIPNQLSSGMYFVHLTQNGENIAVKKLVVQ